MGESLQPNRDTLYNIIKSANPNYTKDEFNNNFKTKFLFDDFVDFIIKKKRTSKEGSIWKKIELTNKEQYYKTYGCDFKWAENNPYCVDTSPTPSNIDNYVGNYTTDNPLIKKIKISKGPDNTDPTKESLYLSSPYFDRIPKFGNYSLGDYAISKLTPTSNPLVFSISNESGGSIPDSITFNNTGFVFKILTFTITAIKKTDKDSDPVTPTKKDDTVVKKDDTVVKKDKDNEIPVVRTKPLYFDRDKKDDTPTKDCSDFPFTLGCVNTKIGDLNAKLFMGDRKKDTYTKSLQSTLDTGNFGPNNPNKELTKNIWNELMNKQVIKESVKKVLKEYINKKK